MEITVRFSPGLAQRAGSPRLNVTLADGATIAHLIDQLSREKPLLAEQLSASVAVVAGRHVNFAESLRSGQEVALLMPVSGGCSRYLSVLGGK